MATKTPATKPVPTKPATKPAGKPSVRVTSEKLDKLTLDPNNARKHGPTDLDAIAASLAKFGQQTPIVIDSGGVIVKGNGTAMAAMQLGWSHIDAIRTALTGEQLRAYAIADNRTAELSEWDTERLLEQLQSFEDADLLAACSFDEAALLRLVEEVNPPIKPEVDEDDVPDMQTIAVTRPGDVWVMGEHRVLCGSSREAADVARLLGGDQIAVAVTSPPYASQRAYDESSGFKPIHPDEYVGWWNAVQANTAAHLAPDGSFFVNIKEHCEDGQRHLYVHDLVDAHVRQWGWRYVEEFVWTHNGTPKAVVNRFKNAWEPIYHFTKADGHKFRPKHVRHKSDGADLDWGGRHPSQDGGRAGGNHPGSDMAAKVKLGRGNAAKLQGQVGGASAVGAAVAAADLGGLAYPSNVLSVGKNREALGHGAAFPVGLPAFFVSAFSDPGDVIYEPFCGSGTTIIAAEQLGRRGRGMEISPQYVDIIVRRWEKFVEGDAVLEETGETFAQVMARRAAS